MTRPPKVQFLGSIIRTKDNAQDSKELPKSHAPLDATAQRRPG